MLQFAGGFRLVADNIRGLGAGGIDGLIIQLLALVAAFNLGINTIGFLAGGISSLLAGVTALAVGIGGALFGGMVALVPVVSALVVGVTALSLGFSKLDKAQKAAFRPLRALLGDLRAGVQEQLFSDIGSQVQGLVVALRPLGPVLNGVAAEFRDWVSQVIAEIGPGGPLAGSFATLGRELPGTFARILDVVSNLSGSLIGLFAAATPAANRLLDSINRVLARFNAWVNSTAGQEAINTFLQQAIDLLDILFGIAGEVGTALSNLWTAGGADAAEQLLTSIREIVANFNEWVSDGGGREALLTWFRQGVDALTALGTVLGSIVTLFNALDTTFTRAGFTIFLGFLSSAILLLADLVTMVQQTTIDVLLFAGTLSGQAANAFTVLGQVASRVWDALTLGFGLVTLAGQQFAGFLRGLRSPMEIVAQSGRELRADLIVVFTAIGTAISDFAARAGRFLRGLRSPMEIVAGSGRELRADLIGIFQQIAAAIARFASDAGAFLGRLRSPMEIAAASGRSLRATLITVFSQIGASLRDLAGVAFRAMSNFASNIGRGIGQAIEVLRRFALDAAAAIGGLPGRFLALGINMMSGLLQGIISGAGRILSYLAGLAAQAAATFAGILDIGSPSKVFEEFGRNITEGLVQGIDQGLDNVLGAADSLAGATFSGLNTPVSNLANQGGDPGSQVVRSGPDIGGITIVTPYANPRLVALEVMDQLAAQGK
jgi:hypothetical protein